MTSYQAFYLLLIAATPAVLGIRWLLKRVKQSGREELAQDISSQFIYEMAKNHLPHIYDALQKLCGNAGIELSEPPPIRFVDLSKK